MGCSRALDREVSLIRPRTLTFLSCHWLGLSGGLRCCLCSWSDATSSWTWTIEEQHVLGTSYQYANQMFQSVPWRLKPTRLRASPGKYTLDLIGFEDGIRTVRPSRGLYPDIF